MTKAYIYEDYLKEPQHLTFERMAQIHREMVSEVGTDEEALEYYDDLIRAAAKYANIRASWCTLDREKKMETDGSRTSAHDSFITNLNMFARLLKQLGKPAAWRDELGYDTEGYGRKALGDFACYLAFVSGINAR
ncbi:MAG: hypothetical protein LUI13_08495 [Lachnospiraceae bacterium]|nr:hypothetical protein [Lachnospiraceae bacterium]